jgi:hypothetical protein
VQDNEELLRNYVQLHCLLDYEKVKLRQHPADFYDYNCLCAIATYYFRDKGLRFEGTSYDYSRDDKFPTREPDKEASQYKIWVEAVGSAKVSTPKSAAWLLYNAVGRGKVDVERARSLVGDEYPEQLHAWDEIMIEFCELGGAYTKKYLRRRTRWKTGGRVELRDRVPLFIDVSHPPLHRLQAHIPGKLKVPSTFSYRDVAATVTVALG